MYLHLAALPSTPSKVSLWRQCTQSRRSDAVPSGAVRARLIKRQTNIDRRHSIQRHINVVTYIASRRHKYDGFVAT